MKSKLQILAELLNMPEETIREASVEMMYKKAGFRPGDKATIGDGSDQWEVACVKRFPHGLMVGIFDEPPSKHVDFWNPQSLTLVNS